MPLGHRARVRVGVREPVPAAHGPFGVGGARHDGHPGEPQGHLEDAFARCAAPLCPWPPRKRLRPGAPPARGAVVHPTTDAHVFCRPLDNCEPLSAGTDEEVTLDAGDVALLRYGLVRGLVQEGKVVLT